MWYFTRERSYFHICKIAYLHILQGRASICIAPHFYFCVNQITISPHSLSFIYISLQSVFSRFFLKKNKNASKKKRKFEISSLSKTNIFSHSVSPSTVKTQRLAYTGTRGLFLNTLGLLLLSAMATSCGRNDLISGH